MTSVVFVSAMLCVAVIIYAVAKPKESSGDSSLAVDLSLTAGGESFDPTKSPYREPGREPEDIPCIPFVCPALPSAVYQPPVEVLREMYVVSESNRFLSQCTLRDVIGESAYDLLMNGGGCQCEACRHENFSEQERLSQSEIADG